MKFLLLLSAISMNLLADSFEIKCAGTDLVYLNEFNLTGLVDTSMKELDLEIETRTSGYEYVLTDYSLIRSFNVESITEFNSDRVIGTRIYSVDKESEIVYINLLLDYPGKLTSQIRLKNGRVFKSTCTQL